MRKNVLDFLLPLENVKDLINIEHSLLEKMLSFKHPNIKVELLIEKVYVRIFTEQPQFALKDKV